MKWDLACDCSLVSAASRRVAAAWPEPDFVIRLPIGQARAFNRSQDDRTAEAQRVPFKHVYDHDDWRPVRPRSAVDMLAALA